MLFLRLQGTVLVSMGLLLGVLETCFAVRFGVFFCWFYSLDPGIWFDDDDMALRSFTFGVFCLYKAIVLCGKPWLQYLISSYRM